MPFVQIGSADGSTKLEKEIKGCVWEFERTTEYPSGDVMKAIECEPVFKGQVRVENRYSEVIRILMIFKAMEHMRTRKSVRKSKVLKTEFMSTSIHQEITRPSKGD